MGIDKDVDAFRTISEVARDLSVPQHVLRFWETKFPNIRPLKRGGGRRYYRRDEIALLEAVRSLLYDDGYTIKGVQRILKEQGVRAVAALADRSVEGPSLRDLGDRPGDTAGADWAVMPPGGGETGAAVSVATLRRRLSEVAREIEACSVILNDARGESRRA